MSYPANVAGTVLALLAAGACGPQLTATSAPSPTSSGPAGTAAAKSKSDPSQIPATADADSMRADPPHRVEPAIAADGLPPVLGKIKTSDQVVFITIDDGYTKDSKVMGVIKSRNIPVTPFLTRAAIADDKEYFAGVARDTGQAVQDHTLTHPQLPFRNEAGQRTEICGAADSYQQWFGERPWMLRPPYGEWNETTRTAAKACGIKYIVMWNVSLPTSQLRYAEGTKLKAGDIILTHWRPDLYRHLPGALDDIKRQGFKIAALQDYLPR